MVFRINKLKKLKIIKFSSKTKVLPSRFNNLSFILCMTSENQLWMNLQIHQQNKWRNLTHVIFLSLQTSKRKKFNECEYKVKNLIKFEFYHHWERWIYKVKQLTALTFEKWNVHCGSITKGAFRFSLYNFCSVIATAYVWSV